MKPVIIAHRGWWNTDAEKNTPQAFDRALTAGYGVEADFRDYNRQLVISHGPPSRRALRADHLFNLFTSRSSSAPLAVNIKADGLQCLVASMLTNYRVANYFLFDMSIPDTLATSQCGLRFFARQSEIEPDPCLYETCAGVWMDCFDSEWMTENDLARHLSAGKEVCIVSPELHGRSPETLWRRLAAMKFPAHPTVMLCTDHPAHAEKYFDNA